MQIIVALVGIFMVFAESIGKYLNLYILMYYIGHCWKVVKFVSGRNFSIEFTIQV